MAKTLSPTAASLLPHHTCSHAPGARSIAVRMPPALVEHHVHPLVAPERCEEPSADTKRGPAVMILLHRLG